jgi:hypothetical protein
MSSLHLSRRTPSRNTRTSVGFKLDTKILVQANVAWGVHSVGSVRARSWAQ